VIKKNKKLFYTIVIPFILIFIFSSLFFLGFFLNFDLKLADNLFGKTKHLNDIVIVEIDDYSLQKIGQYPFNRDNYALVLDRVKESRVVVFDISFYEKSLSDELFLEKLRELSNYTSVYLSMEFEEMYYDNGVLKGRGELLPISEFREFSNVGYVNLVVDYDGVIRKVPLNISNDYKAIAEQVYFDLTGVDVDYNELIINYVGGPRTFKYYSFFDVLNGSYDYSEFIDKIVLIGASAPSLNDNYFVSSSKGFAMPGVEIHANVLNMLLLQSFISKQSDFSLILVLFLLSCLVVVFIYLFDVKIGSLLSLGLIILYLFIVIFMFQKGVVLNIVYPVLIIIFTVIIKVSFVYFFEKHHKNYIVKAFEKYVSKDVVDEIVKDPTKIKLGGELREVTILFSDIRCFTTISESLKPDELVFLLNHYLTDMTKIIMKNKGLVDKFIGDAIMAIYGSPVFNKNHVYDGCLSAIEMRKDLERFNSKRSLKLEIGIGLNTGSAVVGNLGSFDRFDYTAIGDTVNTASRFESLTKFYGVNILVGENTYNVVFDKFLFRFVDLVAVKGKDKYIKVYELIDLNENVLSSDKKKVEMFNFAYELYLKKEWDKAYLKFEEVYNKYNDKVSKIFANRCEKFKVNPPEKNWVGEFKMKTK
jgi:adenylate cyclase